VYRRFVWRRFVEETFCRGDVLYVRLLFFANIPVIFLMPATCTDTHITVIPVCLPR
jgi:hypothetical protein